MTQSTVRLDDVLDDARLVKTRRVGDSGVILAVWHGGHSVNVYTYDPYDPYHTIRPADMTSIGYHSDDGPTRQEARQAAVDMLTMEHEEA